MPHTSALRRDLENRLSAVVLTPAETKIADFYLSHLPDAAFATLHRASQASGASPGQYHSFLRRSWDLQISKPGQSSCNHP